jgi:hypothetical protein
MQIDRTNWMEIILQEFPAFRAQWEEHLESWNPIIARPIALDLAEFAALAIDLIWAGDEIEIARLTTVIELILVEGDPIVEYATRKMVLEKIANSSQIAGFPIERFTTKLQPQTADRWQTLTLDRTPDLSIHH